MAWKQLTVDDLKKILSDDETQKIEEISTESPDVVQEVLDLVASSWRGAWKAKGYNVDVRENYVAPEYAYWVLVHARYAIWTRFPMSPSIALDEARKAEYENALEMLQNPYLATSKPDYSDDPSIDPEKLKIADAAIGIQFQRFGSRWFYSGNNIRQIW